MEEIARVIQSGDQTQLKLLTEQALHDTEVRSQWASYPRIWLAIGVALAKGDIELTLQRRILLLANNLSATSTASSPAKQSGFVTILANLEMKSPDAARLQWQTLANLSHGLTTDSEQQFVDTIIPARDLNKQIKMSPTMIKPFLILLNNLCGQMSVEALQDVMIERNLLEYLLEEAPRWFEGESEYDLNITLLIDIMIIAMERGLLPEFCKYCEAHLVAKVTLFRIVDSILTSKKGSDFLSTSFWSSEYGQAMSETFVKELRGKIPQLISYIITDNRSNPIALLLWNLNCILLESMATIIPLLPTKAVDWCRSEILHDLIALLKACKQLPAKSKLKDVIQRGTGPNQEDFPYLKSSVIPVITSLVKGDAVAQDEIRTSGGLDTILESCVIDGNNPFVKERAIICVRYLLEGNMENQNYVAKMEARQVVDPEVLAKSGYETEIKDGKIRVKKRD